MHTNIQSIHKQFEKSINWNAFLYIVQKSLLIIFTFILFKKFSPEDFSAWANINSIIFLTILWLDCGFRKSIPKYIPKFSKNRKSHILFTKFIFKWQIITLFFGSFILSLYINNIASFIGLKLNYKIIYLIIFIFLIESGISLFRLIYHSHFWTKQFNLFYSIIILFETLANIALLTIFESKSLSTVMIIKIISGLLVNIISIFGLIFLYRKADYILEETIDHKQEIQSFIKHSGIMWSNSIIRSLTERNFLLPLVTFSFGIEIANIFKIANDWALGFQRAIYKTIGTNDTSLLSHVSEQQNKKLVQDACKKIISKILRLCIPLFGIFIILLFNKDYFMGKDQLIFKIFLILIIFYLIESIMSPFERVLEVNKKYLILTITYLPFLFIAYIILTKQNLHVIGLEYFLIVLGSVRLLSSLLIAFYTRKHFI